MENESSFIFNLLIYYCIFRCLFKFKQRDTFFFFLIRNHEAVGKYGKPWIWGDLMDLGVTLVIVSWSDPHIGLPTFILAHFCGCHNKISDYKTTHSHTARNSGG